MGVPVFVRPTSATIPGVTVDYKSCHVAFVTNASDIESIAVYYADRSGTRQAVYGIDPTTTDPRGYEPLVVEYDSAEDRTQIQLAEPRGAFACVIAEAGSDRTTRTNPIERCAVEGFNTAPIASFEVSADPTVGEPVTFTSTAFDPDDPERLSYEWDLDGDGTYETTGQTATTTYDSPGDRTVRHRVTDDCGASNTATATVTVVPASLFEQVAKLTASDGEAYDRFGSSVSVDGDTALVGAVFEDDKGSSAGAAYVFGRHQGGADNWGEVTKLTASDGDGNDNFGRSVSIDGDTALVGAFLEDDKGTNAGAAYVFGRDQGGSDNWGQIAKLTASDGDGNDNFGGAVSVDGDTVLVGAYLEDDKGTNAGAAYVFERNEGGSDNWGQVTKLTASDGDGNDNFGRSVSIDGDTALVGAFLEDDKGTYAGAAYVFKRNEGGSDNWGEITKLTASDGEAGDRFGQSVSVDGDTALVGADTEDDKGGYAGAAYVFERNAGGSDNWGEITKLTASDGDGNDNFGWSVSVDGDTALVGAFVEDEKGTNAGAAYVFKRNAGGSDNWGEIAKLTASDGEAGDRFGHSVSVDDDTALVGAESEDEKDNNAGAAYVFE